MITGVWRYELQFCVCKHCLYIAFTFWFNNPPPNSLRSVWKVAFHLSPKIRSYKWGQKEKRRKTTRNRKAALLKGCVEEIQEQIPVGFIQKGGSMVIRSWSLDSFFLRFLLMLLCPQAEYCSEEADQICSLGLNPVVDRERLPHSTILGSSYYTYPVLPTYSTIYITQRFYVSLLSLSILKLSNAIFKIKSFYDTLLPSLIVKHASDTYIPRWPSLDGIFSTKPSSEGIHIFSFTSTLSLVREFQRQSGRPECGS